jgi:hypothetical protein
MRSAVCGKLASRRKLDFRDSIGGRAMSQIGRKRESRLTTDKAIPAERSVDRGQEPEAAWQFLQKLVLVGLIQPQSEELKRRILVSPTSGPKTS